MIENCIDIFSKYDLPFETYFASNIKHQEVTHQEMELIWVIKGQATIVCQGVSYHLNSHNLFMVYKNRKHSVNTTEGTILISYRYKQDYLAKYNLFLRKIPFENRVYSFKELAFKYNQVPILLLEILKLLISPNESPLQRYSIMAYYNIYVFNLYTSLIKDCCLDIKKPNYNIYLKRIHTILEYTSKHYKESINLTTLANLTDLSTSRLSHFIKNTFGTSYSCFIQHIRLEHALNLLRDTDYAVSEIAQESGFSDHKYLSKMIKSRYDMTPLKYRIMIKKKEIPLTVSYNKEEFIEEIQKCLRQLIEEEDFVNDPEFLIKKTVYDQFSIM